MDNRFEVGDKVQVIKVSDNNPWYHVGDIFSIIKVDTDHPWSAMKYKGVKNGLPHELLWLRNDDIVAYKEEKPKYPFIAITTDGKITKAKLIDGVKTIHEASSTLDDKGTFDFELAVMIAFDRLVKTMGPKIKK